MIISLLNILLAILGLSFLIFIHELGHYWMARRVGMRVETFSIGFGTPIYSWERNGVKWQIGWLLFGGYVKIAGQDLDNERDPYEIPDGFFGKSPWARIKVALMGPVANIVFALFIFTVLWLVGGREKNFSEFTSKIGWVDPASELYKGGIRPGDEIIAYDHKPFQSSKDHLYAPMLEGSGKIEVKGLKTDYQTGKKTSFDYPVRIYPHPASIDKGVLTAGIFQSANYIIYDRLPNGNDNPLPEGSPLRDSGITYGDRILWLDGELIFSNEQMNHLINDNHALLTIKRGSELLLRRVPRVHMQELRPDPSFREEVIDWQFAAKLNNIKTQRLFLIPYNLTNNNVVENELKFIDKDKQDEVYPEYPYSALALPLEPGDQIVAINGIPVEQAYQLLEKLQTYRINVIVERSPLAIQRISTKSADEDFDKQVVWKDLQSITQTLGTGSPVTHKGNYYLLQPIIPKTLNEFALAPETQEQFSKELMAKKKQIESTEDSERKHYQMQQLAQQERRLYLGFPSVQDRRVNYNPDPFTLFFNVFNEIWNMLSALLSGSLNPKWISGPIGIVQVVHDNAMSNIKEAMYWLGAISLNLGVLNLLPIPVLDGGTIVMSFFEMITRKRLKPKTLEKVVIPFAVLLIGFFVFLTYNDLLRLFKTFWQ